MRFFSDHYLMQRLGARQLGSIYEGLLEFPLRVAPTEMAVGIGIEAVTGKAKLSNYPHDYQKGAPALTTEEFLEILHKNKHRLGVSLNESRPLDTLERMYEESLLRVLLIKETLSKTDALIDAVMYRLYGLTKEEIRVVEGKDR